MRLIHKKYSETVSQILHLEEDVLLNYNKHYETFVRDINNMKRIRIAPNFTLYDVFVSSRKLISRYAQNVNLLILRRLFRRQRTNNFQLFPVYGSCIKVLLQRGEDIKRAIEDSVSIFKNQVLCDFRVPRSCFSKVFEQFSLVELERFHKITDLLGRNP